MSDTGTLTFISGTSLLRRTLAWVERSGTVTPIPAPPQAYNGFLLSPDRTRAVVTVPDVGTLSLHVYDLARGSLTRIVPPTHFGMSPVWSSDGRSVYFRGGAGGMSGGASEVFVRPFPNVNGDRVQVSISGGSAPVWSWNSRAIFYSGQGRSEIWRVDIASNGQLGTPVLFLANDTSIQATDIATGGDRVLRIQSIVDRGKGNELRIVLNWFERLKQTMAAAK